MKKTISHGFFVLLALALMAGSASATIYNETIPAGLGTLSYTATVTTIACQYLVGHQLENGQYYDVTYNSFSYLASGVTTPISGSVNSVDSPDGILKSGTCPLSNFPPVTLTGGGVQILFTPSGETGGTAIYEGWINPKYAIIGIAYAPPGSKSTVTYADNTVTGKTTSDMLSFSSGVGQSVSETTSGGVPGFTTKQTTTVSDSFTETQSSSSSIAINQTTSASTIVDGYSDPINGVNHDYDYIFVWLNPIATFDLSLVSGKTEVTWTGYGYDMNDTPANGEMDIIGVELGCLNGDFYTLYQSNPSQNPQWLTCKDLFSSNFSRTWALTNTDGTSPALTPTLASSSPPYNFCQDTGTDLYSACQADPFSSTSYGSKEFPIPGGSYTTADGRFTACQNTGCNTTIEYEPNITKNYSQGYSITQTQGEEYKYDYKLSLSVEDQFTIGGSGSKAATFSASFSATLAATDTFEWTDQFNLSTNQSNGQTASFSITGPAEGYTGPLSFTVYQDNLYGTFMFYPVID